ncbi:Fe2+-dependent dioxygenase [Cyanobium sp. Morenito 9A2]|uniref:Fe2+-dependent dioxygenase n=1 Tax=Cyanobium sp. Morenito 9A2 TaxID=2823718 RepID=UPI0020CC0217|nr:Fe2+-dependent dioxygenase [Cyanobium sp. Morenito 9A2]MCP9848528.1 Fe2+-dependent dioxygenase [Cyanobium sp. Morenito 9A2]
MRFELEALLSPETAASLRLSLLAEHEAWRAGSATAGWHARQVKRNRQLDRSSALQRSLADQVSAALLADPLLQSAALPVRVHGLLFSRSGPGDGYGRHVDNAFMDGGRSDLSFTVFLSPPDHYEGGALVLEQPHGEEAFRLPAGQALVYPSTMLHRVEPVSAGERLVAVGWVQSRVRSAEQRELLFELDTARRTLFAQGGKGEVFDLLCRSYSNLLRMWGE